MKNKELLFHKIIKEPLTKYVHVYKRPKTDNKGQIVTKKDYYLTANLFYDGTHWAIKSKIMNYVKQWFILYLKGIPKIEKCNIEITYHNKSDGFDLDNKVYFWTKVLLDIMKIPTSKQIINSQKYANKIYTINSLKDDTVRYVDEILMKYKKGATAIEIKIYGRKLDEQQQLF